MAKITENVLLEKCSPKTSKLEQITTLDLSKMSLKLEDLPVELLSRLVSMESFDLSGNTLVEFPRALVLPALRHLNLSDNQLEDVTTLEPLRGLEELKMEDNLYITVSDNYKLMVLLPNLRMFNGKDVSTTANHLRFVYSENLRSRIIAVWEKSFRLPDPQSRDKMAALQNQFVSAARQQVKYGPNSVSDFTKWRVEIMAKEYLNSLVNPKEETEINKSSETKEEEDEEEEEEEEISTPSKRKQPVMDSNIRLTPLKKFRRDFPSSPVPESPRKSPGINPKILSLSGASGVRMSPRKKEPTPSTPPTPSRAEGKAQTPNKRPRGRPAKEEKGARLKQEEGVKTMPIIQRCSSKTQTPVVLKPLHVLQCHSKQDSEEDFSTQLWACAFQPLPDSNAGAVSRLVATCGGDSLCVIDCETGMVMKKYKVPGEEFFSLAWSTVLMSRGGGASAQHCSVLAAGGKRGTVKLIHPRNNIAYGEFRASRKALSVLRFNHQQGNFLFTGSYDNKIVMWDIGGVDSHYNYKVVQLLVLEVSATPLHICLPPKAPGSHLLTGCEDGLHCYNTQLGTNNSTKRSEEMEITFPIYKKEDKEHDYHTIDGLSFLTDDIVASKNYSYGCIYLWSWLKTRSQRPDKKSREVCAVLLCELQWADTEIPYLALNTCPGRAYIVCGDDRGRLWTYHVTDLQKSSFQNGKPIVPTQVLEWPCPVRKGEQVSGPSINSVAMDTELQYLVALSDKNMVIVWKREEKC